VVHQRRQWVRLAVVAAAVAVPLLGLLVLSVGAFAGFFAFTRRNLNITATHLAQSRALVLMQTQTAGAWTDTPTLPPATPAPTLVAGEIAKLFDGTVFLSVLLDDNRLVQVPGAEAWFIAVNHRGFGANADLHLESDTQVQLQAVTDARVQLRLLEGSRIFVQSGPYPNGAEIEFAGLPVITTARGCLGTEYTNGETLTVLCFQGACTFSTDFGVTVEEIAVGQSVTMDVNRLRADPARPILAANASPYWDLLQHTGAGIADAQQCDVPAPAPPTPTTNSTRERSAPPPNTPVPPTVPPATVPPAPVPTDPPATEPTGPSTEVTTDPEPDPTTD
jgi:hypothetical protein